MSADPYELPSTHRPIVERGTYIPAWYKEHKDLSIRVVDQEGGDLGFTVADVLPERRWAIGQNGKLISEQEFENRYRDWIGRIVLRDGRLVSVGAVNKYFDITLETVPCVDDFVDAKLDPMKPGEIRFVPINSINLPNPARTKIRAIYNVMGEKVIAGAPQPAPVEGFTPIPVAEPEPEAEPTIVMATSRCGKTMRANRINQHQAICKNCKHFAPGAPEPLDKHGKPLAQPA